MDFLKALKIAASAADGPSGNLAAKPPTAGVFLRPPGLRSRNAADRPFAFGSRGFRRLPVRAAGLAEAARAMMRRAALQQRG